MTFNRRMGTRRPGRNAPRQATYRPTIQQRFEAVLRSMGASWFDGTRYTLDGVTNKVSSIVDRLDASNTLDQATSNLQVSGSRSTALLNGALAFPFEGAQ